MVQGEESLRAGGQTPPPGPDLPSSCSESSGQVPQGAAVQIDSGRVDKHAKLLVTVDLGREPVYQELRRSVDPSNMRPAPSGWKQLTGAASPYAPTIRRALPDRTPPRRNLLMDHLVIH
ncbi:hypothetical protein GCM10010342_65570 [Streptomyces anulatus]|nr:hypothetical protein GCM10010342_65570 [Streptomyces anulatus]